MEEETIRVIIDDDEKYPDYILITGKSINEVCDYMIATRGITNLPLTLYNKFIRLQNEYDEVEDELCEWVREHQEATKYTRD